MSVKSRNGRLEYRFMFRGQDVFRATGMQDTAQNRKLVTALEAADRQRLREGALGIQAIEARSFRGAMDEFVEHEKLARQGRTSSWLRIKTSAASLKAFFGNKTVYLITQADIEKYKLWRLNGDDEIAPVRSTTVRHDLDNLSLFFQWAKQANYARANLVKNVKKPPEGDSERSYILSVDEERRYFGFLQSQTTGENGNLHDLGRLMINQGLRPDETISLEKTAVDLDNRMVRVTKSKTRAGLRCVKLRVESWQILARRMNGNSKWIFPSTRRPGEHIKEPHGPHARALAKLGMNFVLYDLRHTFATRMIEAGVDFINVERPHGSQGLAHDYAVRAYNSRTSVPRDGEIRSRTPANRESVRGRAAAARGKQPGSLSGGAPELGSMLSSTPEGSG